MIKLPKIRKFDISRSTVIAFAVSCATVMICGFIPWYFIIPCFIFLPFLTKRNLACAVAAFTLASLFALMHLYLDAKKSTDIPSHPAQITGVLRCVDKRTSDSSALPPLKAVLCDVTGEDFSFTATVFFPETQRLFYGDTFTFTGNFNPPQNAGLIYSNGKISGEIPPFYGNRPTVNVTKYSATERSFSFQRKIFIVRDILLERLLSKIRTPEACAMAAKLFFGAANAISQEYNEYFINTGTIHLFSVSGLHVGLAAMFILILLSAVPFCIRYYLAAAFTLFYVLLSGSSLPAMRAGCMVILWCILRANLFPGAAWNSLMYTWSLFLLISPDTATSISAQYSFGVTAALLLLSEKTKQIFSSETDFLEKLSPTSTKVHDAMRQLKYKKAIFSTVTAPVAAFASGCGISLFRQYNFAAGSIPANLLIIFISPLLFGTMFFKLIFGTLIPWCDTFGAFILEGTFQLLVEITRSVSESFTIFNIGIPPLWSVVLFYIFLAGTLGIKSGKISTAALFSTLAMFLLWQIPLFQAPPHLVAISSDSDKPPLLAVLYPAGKMAYITDVPDNESGNIAANILRKNGITNATIYPSTPTDRSSRGLKRLARNIDLSIHQPAKEGKLTKAFLRNIDLAETNLNKLPPPQDFSVPEENSVVFRHRNWVISANNSPTGRKIELKSDHGKVYSATLPWCSKPVVWLQELK